MQHEATSGWSLVTAIVCALAVPLPARAAPDLVPEISNLHLDLGSVDPGDVTEGCAGGQTGRRLVRFDLRTRNLGPDDLVLGDPGCPDCIAEPGAACINPLFECSTAHGHAHFESFARAELLDASGAVVAEGRKYGFCILDLECATPQFTCGYQGLTVGCADVYSSYLPCQYIDVTDVTLAPGAYTVRVTIDPEDEIGEASEANNTVEAPVLLGGGAPTCAVYEATDLPQPIPDLASAVSTLDMPVDGHMARVAIRGLRGTHTYLSDLEFHLRSPSGTDVVVMDHVCGAAQNFSLNLDDLATSVIPCPATDEQSHQPSYPLGAFAGESPLGTWTLTVLDTSGLDSGSLDGWGLEVCLETCGDGTVDSDEQCDDGNASDGDCCSSTCSIVTPWTGCRRSTAPGRGRLALVEGGPAADDRIQWRWPSGEETMLEDMGDPTTSDDYRLCVFSGSGALATLFFEATASAGALCEGMPCWKPTPSGYRYLDRDGALTRLTLGAGDEGKAKVIARGKSPSIDLPELPLTLPARVQLQAENGTCWEATYSSSGVVRNDGSRFIAKAD